MTEFAFVQVLESELRFCGVPFEPAALLAVGGPAMRVARH
jgi:hypothetical protein